MIGTVVIAHGGSEVDLLRGLFEAINMDVLIISRDSGRKNIAMSHLPKLLGEKPFTSQKDLHNRYHDLPYYPRRDPMITNLRIYPVMDYDGDNANVLPYVTGNYLRDVPLGNFVTPVLNYPNLEAVMSELGFDVHNIDKGEFYKNLKIRHRPDILRFYEGLCGCETTNMEQVLYDVFRKHPNYQTVIKPPPVKRWECLR